MTQFFIGLYDYFERHKILFYLSLISCVLLMGFFALQVRFEENFSPTLKIPRTQSKCSTISRLRIRLSLCYPLQIPATA